MICSKAKGNLDKRYVFSVTTFLQLAKIAVGKHCVVVVFTRPCAIVLCGHGISAIESAVCRCICTCNVCAGVQLDVDPRGWGGQNKYCVKKGGGGGVKLYQCVHIERFT